MRTRTQIALALGALAIAVGCQGSFPQSTLHPASDYATHIDGLFRWIFGFAVGVFVVVELLLLYVIIRYRARPGAPEPAGVHGNTLLEIGWTLVPAIILILIAVPTIQTIFRTDGTPPEGALEVDVIGHQWWWEYRYPQLGITTANELHVERGRPVSLRLTSQDVIHSFWAPRLGGKRDVMPGRTNRIAFTPDSAGVFSGQCAEFCGESHAKMGLRVVVDEPQRFAAWAEVERAAPAAPESLSELERRGLEAFRLVREPASNSCIACHTVQGVSFGVLGPNLSHVGSRSTIAAAMLPNTPDGLARWLHDPLTEKPGSKMPRIGLSDDEVTALVAYLQSLR
ncbi:MAG: cytochrome c oxidase subunit II [Gemmatimonadetes bacterium RBG_16_66_8]|nr:MAG: cytochrome c oxidase subunit II [Gemmatimonadetes bacterium RBG_16_66_8]